PGSETAASNFHVHPRLRAEPVCASHQQGSRSLRTIRGKRLGSLFNKELRKTWSAPRKKGAAETTAPSSKGIGQRRISRSSRPARLRGPHRFPDPPPSWTASPCHGHRSR